MRASLGRRPGRRRTTLVVLWLGADCDGRVSFATGVLASGLRYTKGCVLELS